MLNLHDNTQWFCVVLSNNRYEKLSQSGEVILKGRQLEEALSNLDISQDDSVSEEVLK